MKKTITESDLDAAVAAAFGRTPTERQKRPLERVTEALGAEAAAVERACPWREAVGWEERRRMVAAEDALIDLRASRRGEPVDVARAAVEASLRQAWANPGGFGTTSDRLDAVSRVMASESAHFRATPPVLAPARAAESGAARKAVRVVDGRGA